MDNESSSNERSPLPLLILTDELADLLWLRQMLADAPELYAEATWCPELGACEDLIRNAHFDVILWDTRLTNGALDAFLQYLTIVSGDVPVVAIGVEPERLGRLRDAASPAPRTMSVGARWTAGPWAGPYAARPTGVRPAS